ncbi:hypothetical protein Plhal304r1_c045g0126451 [Plasmopara halstedii]
MTWQNDQEKKGFIDSHHGPCEGWIDDERIFHSDDCRADYPSYPAEIPVDYSSCTGDCTFIFYWLAVHEPNWQVYKQCAPISNGSDGTSQTNTAINPSIPNVETPSSSDSSESSERSSPTDKPMSSDSVGTITAPESVNDNGNTSDSTITASEADTVTSMNVTSTPVTGGAVTKPTPSCKRLRRLSKNLRLET